MFGGFVKRARRNRSGKISRAVSVGLSIVCIVIGAIAKFGLSDMTQQKHTKELTNEENLVTVETDLFSIELPNVFKESSLPIVNMGDSNTETLKSYDAKDVIVTVSRTPYSEDEKSYIKANSKEKYVHQIVEAMKGFSDSSRKITDCSRISGNQVLFKVDIVKSGLFKNTDQVYLSGMMWYDDEYSYEVDISCSKDNKDKYGSAIDKWTKTFTVK